MTHNQNISCTTCGICHFNIFCSSEINQLIEQQRIFTRNASLYKSKSSFQKLYAIQKGAIKTYHTGVDGKELIRGFYFPGEILGYEAIALGYYPFSATALIETTICEIPYEKFLRNMKHSPELQKQSLTLISMQLNYGSYLFSATAEQKFAAFLLDIVARLNKKEQQLDFVLPMSRQNIGNYLGLTAETISRICSKLSKLNIIFSSRKYIKLLQPNTLQKIVDGIITVEY